MKEQLTLIQILRGLAALSVVLFHMDADFLLYFGDKFYNFDYGYLGVDLFFVLSGFIITYIHFRDIGNRAKVLPFAKKRFIRIYPFYWIILVAYVLLSSPEFAHKPSLRQALDMGSPTWWVIGLKNLLLLPLSSSQMPLGVAWTLTYEMLFYIVFAFAIILGWKGAKLLLFSWLTVIILTAAVPAFNVLPKVVTDPLIIEFMLGCVAGYMFFKDKWNIKGRQLLIGLSAITLLIVGYLSYLPFDRHAIVLTSLMGAAAGFIILFAATKERQGKYGFLSIPLLILAGDASYSIYITHGIFSAYLCEFFSSIVNVQVTPIWLRWVSAISMTLIVVAFGILTHRIIEKPVLRFFRKKLKMRKKTVFHPG